MGRAPSRLRRTVRNRSPEKTTLKLLALRGLERHSRSRVCPVGGLDESGRRGRGRRRPAQTRRRSQPRTSRILCARFGQMTHVHLWSPV